MNQYTGILIGLMVIGCAFVGALIVIMIRRGRSGRIISQKVHDYKAKREDFEEKPIKEEKN